MCLTMYIFFALKNKKFDIPIKQFSSCDLLDFGNVSNFFSATCMFNTGMFSTLILHTSFVFELQQIFNCKSDALLSFDHLYNFIRTGKQN